MPRTSPPSPQPRPYDATDRAPARWMLAALVLLAVLWSAQAVYHLVQDARSSYLGDGLQNPRK